MYLLQANHLIQLFLLVLYKQRAVLLSLMSEWPVFLVEKL